MCDQVSKRRGPAVGLVSIPFREPCPWPLLSKLSEGDDGVAAWRTGSPLKSALCRRYILMASRVVCVHLLSLDAALAAVSALLEESQA